MLLALMYVVLVLARRRRFEALTIHKIEPEESVVLLPQVNVAVGADLFEMRKAEDRVVDFDRLA